jgi:cysteinyl-tRNA synthetase
MSKSLGNFVTIDELLNTEKFGGRKWPGEVIRLAMLKTHYRQPIDWTVRALEEAERDLWRWSVQESRALPFAFSDDEISQEFLAALADDLNTAAAITVLHGLSKFAGRGDKTASASLAATLRFLGQKGGMLSPNAFGVAASFIVSEEEQSAITAHITARLEARRAKNFAESDRIRDELAAMGIALKDGKDPVTGEPTTTWEVKR